MVVVAFTLALVREVLDGKSPAFGEICQSSALQGFLVCSVTPRAVDIDIFILISLPINVCTDIVIFIVIFIMVFIITSTNISVKN